MSPVLDARFVQLASRLTPRRVARRVARSVLGTVTSVETTERVAALTFDDGPDPRWTPPVLEILERYGARATFFGAEQLLRGIGRELTQTRSAKVRSSRRK